MPTSDVGTDIYLRIFLSKSSFQVCQFVLLTRSLTVLFPPTSFSHTGALELPFRLREVGQCRTLFDASRRPDWTLCRDMVPRRSGNVVFVTKIHYLRVV